MNLRLDKIHFNHDAATGAIKIRRNETQTVSLPEWQYGSSHQPEDSPVAYLCPKVPNVIVIKASFYRGDQVAGELEIQAVASANDALGNVCNATVKFKPGGYSDLVPFNLPKAQISNRGVGASTTTWDWQYYAPEKDKWTSFDKSSHRIYSVFGEPTEPWKAELPWAEVLEHACRWADGAKDEPQAAAMITEQVYAMGKGAKKKLTYSRLPTYANEKFDCTAFLQLLNDGVGKGQTVNCDDCATIVSTFGNILGSDLWQSGMGYDFRTNYIFIIGDSRWRRTGFPRHAVAWKNACGENDPLYDACLQVDGDGQPDDNLSTQAILPANLLFGPLSKNLYRFCLFKRGTCEPAPKDERMRRQLGTGYLGGRKFTSEKFLSVLKREFEFDSWADDKGFDKATKALSLSDLLTEHSAFAAWDFSLPTKSDNKDFAAILQVLLRRPAKRVQKLVDVNLYECRRTASPSYFVLQLLAQFHKAGVKRVVDRPLGDVTFVEPYRKSVLFKHGKFVALVRSVGMRPFSTLEMAKAIEDYFAARSS